MRWRLVLALLPLFTLPAAATPSTKQLQKSLGIPPSIASVKDAETFSTSDIPEFIIMQDVHRHAEVQGHISALLLHGLHKWGVHDVYLEGAQAGLPVARPVGLNDTTLHEALEEGRISGAQMAKTIATGSALRLHGIEDPKLYLRNVLAYQRVEALRSQALRELHMARLLERGLDLSNDSIKDSDELLIQRLLRLKLKPADVARYLALPAKQKEGPILHQAIEAALSFYRVADERSRQFVQTIAKNTPHEPKVVIVGGYHTLLMTQELQRLGRSYVVLRPNVTQGGSDELYAKGMEETISALNLREQTSF